METSVWEPPRSALCLRYPAEWQIGVIPLSKAELCSDSLTLPLNQLMAYLFIYFLLSGFLWQPLKSTQRREQLLPNPNPSLQHVQYILCMSYIDSVRLVFLWAEPLLLNETILTETLFQLHWVTHYMHHLSCDVFSLSLSLSLSPWKIGSLSNHMQCASPPLSFEEIIMWHCKETQANSPLKPPLYVIADISAPFGGAGNCFNNECGSRGGMRGHLDVRACRGKPTVYRAFPLGYTVFHVCL